MTNIEPVKRNPGEYDVVVIGTPVWAGTTAPAIRTYLDRFAPGLKSVAFFCTLGGTNISDTFDAMSRVSGKNPIATIWFSKKQIASGSYSEKLAEFSNKLK
jgi:multimeric flavodoxin WrbA